jgi:hypothetical protein
MTEASTSEPLEAALRQFTGTEHWYRHPLYRTFCYTDGVKYLAEAAGAYWLIDDILACQIEPRVKNEAFQFWTLTVRDNHTAVLTCTDGNTALVYRQEYGFTDFPLKEQKLYLTNNVLLLPSEY